VNIANFALGRNASGAVGVVNLDEEAVSRQALEAALDELRRIPAVREVFLVRLN
jgi:hypothetical protein